jgi:hypothetical protein
VSKIIDRVADAGGVLFIVLVGVGYTAFVAPHTPQDLTDPDQVVRFLTAHPPTTSFWIGTALEAAGLTALLLFATRLAVHLRAAAPASGMPSAVVALAVAAFTVKLSSITPVLAALHVGRYDAGTVTALLDINDAAFTVSWAVDGAFALLVGLAALSYRALPRWVAGSAVVAGTAILVGTAVPELFDTMQLVFLVWLVATSGWLLTHPSPSDHGALTTSRAHTVVTAP